MPIKRGEVYLFISFCGEKFSPKMIDKKDRRRVKKSKFNKTKLI